MDYPILKLLLQPFIENSIKHGFNNFEEDGIIFIYARLEEELLHIIVEDNGSGISQKRIDRLLHSPYFQEEAVTCVGIQTCMERLRLQYGNAYTFSIESDEKSFTRISLSYPVKEDPHVTDITSR